MILIWMFLAVVAFIETVVGVYLFRQVKRLGLAQVKFHQRDSDIDHRVEEADLKYQEAEKLYDEARQVVVQARAGNPSLSLH